MARSPGRPILPWRVAVWSCALVLTLLILLQPLLCVAHCLTQRQPAEAGADPAGIFLCHTAPVSDQGTLLIPAFWPGVLPALLLLTFAGSFRRIAQPGLARFDAHPWAPPLPPPRASIA